MDGGHPPIAGFLSRFLPIREFSLATELNLIDPWIMDQFENIKILDEIRLPYAEVDWRGGKV